jgi:CcmD family protein
MGSFSIAYLILWLGVAGYVVRLGAEHRRLQRTLEGLEAQLAQSAGPEHPAAKVA